MKKKADIAAVVFGCNQVGKTSVNADVAEIIDENSLFKADLIR